MRRFFALLLAALLIFSLAACGETVASEPPVVPEVAQPAEPSPEEFAEQERLAELARRGITVQAVLRNLGSGVVEHGSVPELRHKLKIDGAGIAAAYEELSE